MLSGTCLESRKVKVLPGAPSGVTKSSADWGAETAAPVSAAGLPGGGGGGQSNPCIVGSVSSSDQSATSTSVDGTWCVAD